MKLIGAAYLVYLGITTLRDRDTGEGGVRGVGRPGLTPIRAWTQGLLSALLNPKLGVFFLTLLPQFIEVGQPPAVRLLQLAVVFDLIGLTWLLAYTALLAAAGNSLGNGDARRLVRWLSGTVLIALGLRVAVERT